MTVAAWHIGLASTTRDVFVARFVWRGRIATLEHGITVLIMVSQGSRASITGHLVTPFREQLCWSEHSNKGIRQATHIVGGQGWRQLVDAKGFIQGTGRRG